MKNLKYLLIALPFSIFFSILDMHPMFTFIFTCISIIPLASIIGNATEQISIYAGDKVGGLLNATMGNLPELFIGIFSIKAGLFDIVKTAIVGSMLGNLLFILGITTLIGGLKYQYQHINKSMARSNFVMLFYSLIGITLPLAILYTGGHNDFKSIENVSITIAILMFMVYLGGLFFSLITHKNIFTCHDDKTREEISNPWSKNKSILVLMASASLVALQSEILVSQLESLILSYHIPIAFIGIIVIPIIGNVSEYASAVMMAAKGRIDLSLEIAVGSSIQMALFVGPLLVFISVFLRNPMNYIFPPFHVLSLIFSCCMALYVFQDGKTTWLEGFIMLCIYILLAASFFYVL